MLKVAGGVGGSTGQLSYQGTWNAATNTPTLASGVGVQNHYYVVSVAGTTNLDGITDWEVNDWALFNGSVWQKIDQSDLVASVNGQTGVVVLNVGDISGAVPNTVNVLPGTGMTGGGALTGNVTITLANTAVVSATYGNSSTVGQFEVDAQGRIVAASNQAITIAVANCTGAVPNTVNVLASGLLTGGGALTGNVTIDLTSVPVANVPGAVPNTVNVLAGGLLTGGGALTGNVTISLTSVPAANITGLGTMASQNANAVTITGGDVTANITTSDLNLTSATAANATFATASLPLVPEGYITVDIGGVAKKIPYYGV